MSNAPTSYHQVPAVQAQAQALRAKDAARVYGVGESTIWLYAQQGKLRPVRLGKRLTLFPIDQLNALFLGAQTDCANSERAA